MAAEHTTPEERKANTPLPEITYRLPYITAIVKKILLNTAATSFGWVCKIINTPYIIEYDAHALEYSLYEESKTGSCPDSRLLPDLCLLFKTKDFLRFCLELYNLRDTVLFLTESDEAKIVFCENNLAEHYGND